jgi:ribosomal protein L7Ae-like RNA K-turn-binding protein
VIAACEKGVFPKAAKDKVSVPNDMADLSEGLLRKRCHELMGMARRAGQMVGGYAKVGLFLSSKNAGLIIVASDSKGPGYTEKKNISPDAKFVFCFSSTELGRIFDRDKIVYAVIGSGSFATNLLFEIRRLSGFF